MADNAVTRFANALQGTALGANQQQSQQLGFQPGNAASRFADALQGIGPGVREQQFNQQQFQNIKFQDLKREQKLQRAQAAARDLVGVRQLMDAGDFQGATQLANNRKNDIVQLGGDPSHTQKFIDLMASGDIQGASKLVNLEIGRAKAGGFLADPKQKQQILGDQLVSFGPGGATATDIEGLREGGGNKGAEQEFFESLLVGQSEEDQNKAKRIKLGLKGRAVSNAILSAIASGDINKLSDAKAQIRQEGKFAEMTGASRAKAIDSGIESIRKIDAGIANMDRAIVAIQGGAGVGAIEKNFPSIKAASVELDNIQKSMALDVIGSVTFGALSKGELDLAREVALPTGLESGELIAHLQARKAAQNKLRAYYNEQIQHLDQGGTVASFMRKKEREKAGGQQPAEEAAPAQNRNIQVDF